MSHMWKPDQNGYEVIKLTGSNLALIFMQLEDITSWKVKILQRELNTLNTKPVSISALSPVKGDTYFSVRSWWLTRWSSVESCTAALHTPQSWTCGSDAHGMTCTHLHPQSQRDEPAHKRTTKCKSTPLLTELPCWLATTFSCFTIFSKLLPIKMFF